MRSRLLVAAAAALAVSTFSMYVWLSSHSGAYLVLHGLPRGYAAVYIEAVEPQGPVPLHAAAYRVPADGNLVVELPWAKLQALAGEWRKHRPGLREFGLVIHLVVVDPAARRVKLHLLDSVSVPVDAVLAGRRLVIEAHTKRVKGVAARLGFLTLREPGTREMLTLKPAENVTRRVDIGEKHRSVLGEAPEPPLEHGVPPSYRVCMLVGDPISLTFLAKICWDPIVYVAPENIAYLYSDRPGAVMYQDGVMYVQTPIAVVYNRYLASGLLDVAIGVEAQSQSYRVYPSFGVDLTSLVRAVKRHVRVPLPSLNIWRGEGATWGGDKYFVYVSAPVEPGKYVTFYVYARPFYVIYNVSIDFILPSAGTDTETEALALVSDVALKPGSAGAKYIKAGYYEGKPPAVLMEAILRGGNLTYAATLEPGQGMMLKHVLANVVGTCGVDFGISMPVGAAAAAIVCSALAGIPVADAFTAPACVPLMIVASNFQVSFVAEPGYLKVAGGLMNLGEWHGIGYDLDEFVYVERSAYYYDINGCTARVPIGVYIESR